MIGFSSQFSVRWRRNYQPDTKRFSRWKTRYRPPLSSRTPNLARVGKRVVQEPGMGTRRQWPRPRRDVCRSRDVTQTLKCTLSLMQY